MNGYLGETLTNEYDQATSAEWALMWIERYGNIDGSHHKDWVLDQVARILNGTKVIVTEASWDNGYTEYRFRLSDEECVQYNAWVQRTGAEEYDTGIAP